MEILNKNAVHHCGTNGPCGYSPTDLSGKRLHFSKAGYLYRKGICPQVPSSLPYT